MGDGFPIFIYKVSRFYQICKAVGEFINDGEQMSHYELHIFWEKNLLFICQGFFLISLAAIKFFIDQELKMNFDLFDISRIFEAVRKVGSLDFLHNVHPFLKNLPDFALVCFEFGDQALVIVIFAYFMRVFQHEGLEFVLVDLPPEGTDENSEVDGHDTGTESSSGLRIRFMFFLLGNLFQGLFCLRKQVFGGGSAIDGYLRIPANFVLAITVLFTLGHLLHNHTFQLHFGLLLPGKMVGIISILDFLFVSIPLHSRVAGILGIAKVLVGLVNVVGVQMFVPVTPAPLHAEVITAE